MRIRKLTPVLCAIAFFATLALMRHNRSESRASAPARPAEPLSVGDRVEVFFSVGEHRFAGNGVDEPLKIVKVESRRLTIIKREGETHIFPPGDKPVFVIRVNGSGYVGLEEP